MVLKKIEKYDAMPAVKQIEEIKKWIESELDDAIRSLQQLVGFHPDGNRDVENVMATPYEDLPTLINNYDEDSLEYALVKKRIADNISEEDTWDLLDSEWGADKVKEKIQCMIDCSTGMLQADQETLHTNYFQILNLMELSTLCGDEDLHKKVTTWLPPVP